MRVEEEKDRYWSVFKFCPLSDGNCNSKCVNFKKVGVREGDSSRVRDIAECTYFKRNCAYSYKEGREGGVSFK